MGVHIFPRCVAFRRRQLLCQALLSFTVGLVLTSFPLTDTAWASDIPDVDRAFCTDPVTRRLDLEQNSNPGNSRYADRDVSDALREMVQHSLEQQHASSKSRFQAQAKRAFGDQSSIDALHDEILLHAAQPKLVTRTAPKGTLVDAAFRAVECSQKDKKTATSGSRHWYCRQGNRVVNVKEIRQLALAARFSGPTNNGLTALSIRGKPVPHCSKWNVVTTLKPTVTTVQLTEQQDQGWCTVIVLDKNSAPESAFVYHDQPYLIVLTAEDQEELPYKMLQHMPWKHFGRKNIGYLLAIHHGAEVIYDTDDDNQLFPLQNAIPADKLWALQRNNSTPDTQRSKSSVTRDANVAMAALTPRQVHTPLPPDGSLGHVAAAFLNESSSVSGQRRRELYHNGEYRYYHVANPYVFFGGRGKGWPRGYPLDKITTDEAQNIQLDRLRAAADDLNNDHNPVPPETGRTSYVGVVQTLAHADPDYDAIYRLTRKLPVMWRHARTTALVYERGTFAPFNAQATLWHETAFWGLVLPVTVHGRVSDIWRSYITQRVMWETGLHVAFNSPWVNQYRNAHDYLKDFDSEQPLYHSSGDLLSLLTAWQPTQEFARLLEGGKPGSIKLTAKHALAELMVVMYEFGVIDRTDLEATYAYLGDLTHMGYVFPTLQRGHTSQRRQLAPVWDTMPIERSASPAEGLVWKSHLQVAQNESTRNATAPEPPVSADLGSPLRRRLGRQPLKPGWTEGDTLEWPPITLDPNRPPSKCRRVAICMLGRLRSGMYTYRQNKEYFFDRLGCPYDLFLVLADDEAGTAGSVFGAAAVRGSQQPNSVLLKNRNALTKLAHKHLWQNIVHMFIDWKTCGEMVDDYSITNGVEYDWIVRHRFDQYLRSAVNRHSPTIADLPDNAIVITNKNHHDGINDRQAIGPKHLMDKYLRIYDHLEQYMQDDSFLWTEGWLDIAPGYRPHHAYGKAPTAEGILAFHFWAQKLPRSYQPHMLMMCKVYVHEELPLVQRAPRRSIQGLHHDCKTNTWSEAKHLDALFDDEVYVSGKAAAWALVDGMGAVYKP